MPPKQQERLIRIIDEHWMIYVRPLFLSFIVLLSGLLLLLVSAVSVTHVSWLASLSYLAGAFLVLLSLHGIFFSLLNEALSQIVVTSRRLVHFDPTIPLTDELLEITFEKMKNVEVEKHGVLQTVLNYGVLNFENGKAKIRFVPHPNSVARDIHQAMGML